MNVSKQLVGSRRNWIRALLGLATAGLAGPALYQAAWKQWQLSRNPQPAPEGMVLIPAGWFLMGSDDPEADPDERPLRKVFLPAFYMDRFEVTNAEYQRFDPSHTFEPGQEQLPVSHVYREEARAYAASIGKRLPTSAEWEKAARGTDGRRYPWGNEFEDGRSNLQPASLAASEGWPGLDGQPPSQDPVKCRVQPAGGASKQRVGSFPTGASPYGCEDMAGNVWEWVEDVHQDPKLVGWLGETIHRGILKGGAFGYGPRQGRSSYQAFEDLAATCNDTGFRCARSA